MSKYWLLSPSGSLQVLSPSGSLQVMLLGTNFNIIVNLFSKENLTGKTLGTSLHFVDGTQCKPVGADYLSY
jgi:hypothetical protein